MKGYGLPRVESGMCLMRRAYGRQFNFLKHKLQSLRMKNAFRSVKKTARQEGKRESVWF